MLIDTNAESVVRTLKSEKQQAECTAARAAPIVFPRGRPFDAPAGTYSRPVDTPTPRRGAGGERKAPCKRHDTATLPKSVPCRGLTRRYRREEGLAALWGALLFGWRSEGSAASGKPHCARRRNPSPGGPAPADSGADRVQPSQGALTLFFRWRKKSVQKPAARQLCSRPTSHCGQALRYACAWLRPSWPSAISGASRPSASLGGGLRSAVAPSGLSSTSVRFAHPSGEKALYCPF